MKADGVTMSILPFRSHDEERAHAVFSRGLSSLIGQTFRESARNKYISCIDTEHTDAGNTAEPSELGPALGVDYLLAGETLWSGEDFKVLVRLIDTADATVIWHQSFTGGAGDLFER